ncbi:MAG TPA: class I SAM-dependent methyltransferase [Limnochordia bacterium]|nr:class I SAM-dependent methyltransferase [Limnochordia bacterium]
MADSAIRYYNENARAYFDSTVALDMGKLYGPFLKHLRPGSKVLDAGCGSGRDSLFFKNQGFQVTAFDASKEMVKLASELLDQKVLLMSFEDLSLTEQYDGIWACASLLHVEKAKLSRVVAELAKHLKDGGVFYISFKYGREEYWKEGRYFNHLDEDTLKEILQEVPELRTEQLFISTDVRGYRSSDQWLNAYLIKG